MQGKGAVRFRALSSNLLIEDIVNLIASSFGFPKSLAIAWSAAGRPSQMNTTSHLSCFMTHIISNERLFIDEIDSDEVCQLVCQCSLTQISNMSSLNNL